jgi:hypothetical protein
VDFEWRSLCGKDNLLIYENNDWVEMEFPGMAFGTLGSNESALNTREIEDYS